MTQTTQKDGVANAPSNSSNERFKELLIVFTGTAIFLSLLYLADTLSPLFRYGHTKIAEEEIEAGAIFYTGVSKVSEAERVIRSSTDYSPLKGSKERQ
jgi:hypothetical protein